MTTLAAAPAAWLALAAALALAALLACLVVLTLQLKRQNEVLQGIYRLLQSDRSKEDLELKDSLSLATKLNFQAMSAAADRREIDDFLISEVILMHHIDTLPDRMQETNVKDLAQRLSRDYGIDEDYARRTVAFFAKNKPDFKEKLSRISQNLFSSINTMAGKAIKRLLGF